MAARTGQVARIRHTSATVTTATNEAADLSTDGVTLSINATAKRHWDNGSTLPRVYDHSVSTSVAVASSDISNINYVQGTITFDAARSTSNTYVMDVAHLTASYLPDSQGWAMDLDVNSHDVTTFATSATDPTFRTRIPGLVNASVTIDKFIGASTAPVFFDNINLQTDLIVELVADEGVGRYEGYFWPVGLGEQTSIDDVAGESVTLLNNGPVYYTTG